MGPARGIDARMNACQYLCVANLRRITANLPEDLLDEAMAASGKGITDTLTEGLRLVKRTRAYVKAMRLKGKIKLDVDLERSRERRRR